MQEAHGLQGRDGVLSSSLEGKEMHFCGGCSYVASSPPQEKVSENLLPAAGSVLLCDGFR